MRSAQPGRNPRAAPELLRSPGFWATLLGLLAFATYSRTLAYALVWDDLLLLKVLEARMAEQGLRGLLLSDFRLEIDEPLGFYRPIVNLSLWVDHKIAAFFPPAFHLSNVLLHAANTLLVFRLARLILPELPAAVAGAALFALHPVHVESVAFVAGRTDLWAAFFALLSAGAFLKDRLGGVPSRWSRLVWGSGCLVLGALSKEVALLLPVVLLACAFLIPSAPAVRAGEKFRGLLPWLVAWAAAIAVAAGIRVVLAGVPFGAVEIHTGQRSLLSSSPLRVLGAWATYLKLLWFPWPMVPYYAARQIALSVPSVVGALAVLLLCALHGGRSCLRIGSVGFAWLAAFLVPVSGILPLAGALVAQRFLYLPSVGFCLVLGHALSRVLGRHPGGQAAVAVSVAGAALLGAATLTSASFWKDDLSLAQQLSAQTPESVIGAQMMGNALFSRGRRTEALAHFSRAAQLQPDSYKDLYNHGYALFTLGRYEEAARVFARAVAVKPGEAMGWHDLGIALIYLKKLDDAVGAIEKAAAVDPANRLVRQDLARLHAQRGDIPRALEQVRALERIDTRAAARLREEIASSAPPRRRDTLPSESY